MACVAVAVAMTMVAVPVLRMTMMRVVVAVMMVMPVRHLPGLADEISEMLGLGVGRCAPDTVQPADPWWIRRLSGPQLGWSEV